MKTLKQKIKTFKIGTKIRAYDFPDKRDCFYEGVISSVDGKKITADISKAVSLGVDVTELQGNKVTQFTTHLHIDSERQWSWDGQERIEVI